MSFFVTIDICKRDWFPECKLVILAAITNCFNVIWDCRNEKWFSNRNNNLRTDVNLIITSTSISGDNNKLFANSSISIFVILKAFNVKI